MAARRKPPSRGSGLDASANLVAWLVLAIGFLALGRTVYRESSSGPRLEHPHSGPSVASIPKSGPRTAPSDGRRDSEEPTHGPRATDPLPAPRAERAAESPPHDLLRVAERQSRPVSDPRVAIIIDDIGQDLATIEQAQRLPTPLTFAVIPHLPHSRAAAETLNARGYEIILHLPMEPLAYPDKDPGLGAVLSNMDAAEVRRTVLADLAAVPHVSGVNNHMGSRITADRQRMRAVLQTLTGTAYFFIDSRTTESSVAFDIARELHIPAARRAVFLDAKLDAPSVERELLRAVEIAKKYGSAIAIGHPHPVTFEVLRRQLPGLRKHGVSLVFASELTL